MINLFVDSQIHFDVKEVPRTILTKLIKRFTYKDPYYKQCKIMGIPTMGMPSKISTCELKKKELYVWRGALGNVKKFFRENKLECRVIDKRLKLEKIDLSCSIKLRDYQKKPTKLLIKRQQGLGRAPAGSGKTEIMLKVLSYFQQPSLVLVWQERQQRTWLDRIPEYFDFEPGGIGGVFSKPKIAPITVGLVQSVGRHVKKYQNLFGAVACDECQRFAAKTFRTLINELPAAIRIGASDDERRRDEREFLLYDSFGPTAWRLKPGTGQCSVAIHLVPTEYNSKVLNSGWPDKINAITRDKPRNKLIVDLAKREVDAGHRVLIWSDRTKHCHELQKEFNKQGYRSGLLIGTIKQRKEADKTEQGLRDGNIEIGIGTSIAEQSINIKPLDRGIVTCCSADKQLYRFKQIRGRLARPLEDKKSILYYMWDYQIPSLSRKILNISKLYKFKKVKLPFVKKEKVIMPLAPVTIETLKLGCKELKIKIPKDVTQKKLESLIKRELQKDVTYAAYSCGACQRDIVDKIPLCPYCTAKFSVFQEDAEDQDYDDDDRVDDEDDQDQDYDDQDQDYDDDDDQDDADYDDDDDQDSGDDSEDDDDQVDDDDDGYDDGDDSDDNDYDDDDQDNDDSDTDYDDDDDQDDEPEPPRKRGRVKKQKTDKEKADKKAEKEHRHAELTENLPYKFKEIKAWSRPVLAILCSIYKIKQVGLKKEEMVAKILKYQSKKYGPEFGIPGKKGDKASKPPKQSSKKRSNRREQDEEEKPKRRKAPKGAIKPGKKAGRPKRRPQDEERPRKRRSR